MRRPLSLGLAVLVAALGVLAPGASRVALAASSDAKVVIIVGATHSVTAAYRADADEAYAEAIKYTPNVVKVYSPNATWAKVKAATAGASIVIYFGHGNGWPSPYPNDAAYTTKDGFGLNYDLNGDGKLSDYENHYYGEPSVSTLDLAPNAVVILSHLCYASGNSEPGMAAPSLSVPPAGRQLRGGLPQGRGTGRDRRRSRRTRGLHPVAVHDPPVDRRRVDPPVELPLARQLVRVDPHAGRDGLHGPGHDDRRLLPVARRAARPHE